MDIDGTPDDLTVFDATYDAATGDVTYGGFIFHGERITWDSVDPGMVTTAPVTGYQTFAGGNYSFTNASGYKFNIICAEGADLPEVTRKIDISANPNGISIDGKPFPWSALTDEDDSGASAGNKHAGSWCINYEGADVAFYIPYDIYALEDLADAINSSNNGKVTYSWHEEYIGPEEVQAVDAEVMKNLRISNALAEKLGNDYSLTVRAGWDSSNNEDGIWLQNSDGSAINGSFVTMKQADAGSYVKLADGTYEAYDSTKHAGVAPSDRFDMDTQYKKISDGTNAAGLNDVIDDYKFHAIDKMLTTSNLQLDANDYTQMGISGNEKQNVAIKSVFESKLVESPYDNYLYIQQSSQKDDVTKIPRFPMNTVKLRLYRANTKSIESAQKTIGYAEYALSVLSEKRSLYGAYHNRLESAYSLNAITGENLQAAESLIRDADIAAEMVQSSRNNILQQAAQAMLAQANQAPNQILNLLQ